MQECSPCSPRTTQQTVRMTSAPSVAQCRLLSPQKKILIRRCPEMSAFGRSENDVTPRRGWHELTPFDTPEKMLATASRPTLTHRHLGDQPCTTADSLQCSLLPSS